jgi:hypothetical protein
VDFAALLKSIGNMVPSQRRFIFDFACERLLDGANHLELVERLLQADQRLITDTFITFVLDQLFEGETRLFAILLIVCQNRELKFNQFQFEIMFACCSGDDFWSFLGNVLKLKNTLPFECDPIDFLLSVEPKTKPFQNLMIEYVRCLNIAARTIINARVRAFPLIGWDLLERVFPTGQFPTLQQFGTLEDSCLPEYTQYLANQVKQGKIPLVQLFEFVKETEANRKLSPFVL